jgi:hypothetical protein
MGTKQTRRVVTGGMQAGEPGASIRDGADFAAGLRRRRETSLRLGPFGDGPADPLDAFAGLPIGHGAPCCRGEFGPLGAWQPCCGRGAA